jgi:hypothetical protein
MCVDRNEPRVAQYDHAACVRVRVRMLEDVEGALVLGDDELEGLARSRVLDRHRDGIRAASPEERYEDAVELALGEFDALNLG